MRAKRAKAATVVRAWLLLTAFLAFVPVRALARPWSVDVIPLPESVQAGDGGAIQLRDGAPIVVGAHDAGALRTARWLSSLALRSRGLRLVPTSAPRQAGPQIVLERRAGSRESESYQISIARGHITIRASSDAGLLYGAVTLWQLITVDEGRGPVRLANLRLEDHPRLAWRGLLLDSARHMQSVAFIESMIDWMALHKLNVLQWHLTDDQGWRLPIEGYPRLTTIGAWRVPASVGPAPIDPTTGRQRRYGGFYSRAEIRAIVAHARARNVTIVPEVEMPGHALSALLAYPELSAGPLPPRSMQSDWGLIPAAYGVDERVFSFLRNVLGQVMDLFPGRFIAIGGDEIPLQIWKTSPEVQTRMKALGITDELGLQNYFIRRVGTILAARGRRMIGWEEILQGGPLPPDAAITSWRGAQSAVTAAKAGHDVVLGIAPTLYFDNRQSEIATEPPGRGWVVSLHDVYAVDPGAPTVPPPPARPVPAPVPPMILTEADRAHLVGVQGNLWTEHIRTEDRLAKMAFPRAAAVAEAGWTAQADRDWPGFLARLPAEMSRFSRLGLDEDDSAFAIDMKAAPDDAGSATVTLANQTRFGQIHYSLDGQLPTVTSLLYSAPLRVTLPARLQAATFVGSRRISTVLDKSLDADSVRTRVSQQLTLCPGGLPLILEGQTAEGGTRSAFLVQVMNPCWIWPDADLSDIAAVKLDVVSAPFNLQLGADLDKIVHRKATSPGGEIQVRLDNCDTGELLAAAPLPEGRTEFTATVSLPARKGAHVLCFAYAGARVDPIWGLRQVELLPRTGEGRDHG